MDGYTVEVRNANGSLIERVIVLGKDLLDAHNAALRVLRQEYKDEDLHASSVTRVSERIITPLDT